MGEELQSWSPDRAHTPREEGAPGGRCGFAALLKGTCVVSRTRPGICPATSPCSNWWWGPGI